MLLDGPCPVLLQGEVCFAVAQTSLRKVVFLYRWAKIATAHELTQKGCDFTRTVGTCNRQSSASKTCRSICRGPRTRIVILQYPIQSQTNQTVVWGRRSTFLQRSVSALFHGGVYSQVSLPPFGFSSLFILSQGPPLHEIWRKIM